jgi:hypothetical protein
VVGIGANPPRRMLVALRSAAVVFACLAAFWAGAAAPTGASADAGAQTVDPPLALEFATTVTPRLEPPSDVVAAYAVRLDEALAAAGAVQDGPRFVLLLDRSPSVQALLLFWGTSGERRLVGAAPVSTGLPGRYDHFATPLGAFAHVLGNPDFRSEGTRNALGIRGYGRKGARVYDFGWVAAAKGWGDHAVIEMRLQMHATDPERLEPRLGSAQSKGCIRIPVSLNAFIDRFGVLDQDYDDALARGERFWVLRDDREPTPWAGRYIVVVDSGAERRPEWSPAPAARR